MEKNVICSSNLINLQFFNFFWTSVFKVARYFLLPRLKDIIYKKE